jgi:hypothetical protein
MLFSTRIVEALITLLVTHGQRSVHESDLINKPSQIDKGIAVKGREKENMTNK